jgi:hypothetical protein
VPAEFTIFASSLKRSSQQGRDGFADLSEDSDFAAWLSLGLISPANSGRAARSVSSKRALCYRIVSTFMTVQMKYLPLQSSPYAQVRCMAFHEQRRLIVEASVCLVHSHFTHGRIPQAKAFNASMEGESRRWLSFLVQPVVDLCFETH